MEKDGIILSKNVIVSVVFIPLAQKTDLNFIKSYVKIKIFVI